MHPTKLGSCLLCQLKHDTEDTMNENCSRVDLDDGSFGFEKNGKRYHCCDVVLCQSKADSGPCLIGYITEIADMERDFEIEVKVFKRMSDIKKKSRIERETPFAEPYEV